MNIQKIAVRKAGDGWSSTAEMVHVDLPLTDLARLIKACDLDLVQGGDELRLRIDCAEYPGADTVLVLDADSARMIRDGLSAAIRLSTSYRGNTNVEILRGAVNFTPELVSRARLAGNQSLPFLRVRIDLDEGRICQMVADAPIELEVFDNNVSGDAGGELVLNGGVMCLRNVYILPAGGTLAVDPVSAAPQP